MNIDAAVVAVADFLQPLMPVGTQIVRGQVNDVPAPLPPSIVITEIGQPQYTTTRKQPITVGGTQTYVMPVQLRFQLDFYGWSGGEMSNITTTMIRSLYPEDKFPEGVKPLYCTNAFQSPLMTGEKQFEARWTQELYVQYNAPVTVVQESFNTVGEVIADPVNATIPVE
ncbi:MAG: hypothetical protein [Caudoviricetes sp.]|nr:MAG: hypothetical protein [Caudoviricetes sp.]